MSAPFVVSSQFNGPATSGNGGYVGGRLAAELQARRGKAQAVEVTLRAALTLDKPLEVRDRPDGGVSLYDGEQLLAEAVATSLAPEVPTPPSLEEARAASAVSVPARMSSGSTASHTASMRITAAARATTRHTRAPRSLASSR